MQFENKDEQIAFDQFRTLFGIVSVKPHTASEMKQIKLERKHRSRFYRECSLLQATLKGYERAVKQRYNAIHRRGLTVDHIVPLNGHDKDGNHVVCGLNVPWNLRGETLEKNGKKADLFVDNRDAIAIILPSKQRNKA